MSCFGKLWFVTLNVVLAGSLAVAQNTPSKQDTKAAEPVFGGNYAQLNAEQKRLVDDWFRRLSGVLEKPISPEEGYDHIRLSVRTTFVAVTHALLRTPMTDRAGASLEKSALSLVRKVDNVAGSVEGERGDRQFRMYVELVPGALELLAKSQEFDRKGDNTIYHKGYPVCYRSKGGAPSIQISTTRDGKLADIDVDYRSAKFPAFLFNGHLSASNSDVRAGDNDQRHNTRWEGLRNWWRTLLGLPYLEKPPAGSEGEDIPVKIERTKPNAKPSQAVHDFLTLWLVDRRPDEAVAYFSESAYVCMEFEQGRPIDRGMAPFVMLKGLQEINQRIGKVANLSKASVGVRLVGPRIRAIQQPYHAQFVLYDVREDLAERFKCGNRLNPEQVSLKAARSKEFGKYVGAVFKLKARGEFGETVATLWKKERTYWKLISYDVEPEAEALRKTAAAPPAKAPALAYVDGDPELIRAARDFYEKWFVRKRVEAAFQYLSPRSYSCAGLYQSEETPEPKTQAKERQLIRSGMEKIAEVAGPTSKLTDAIVAPEPSHPDIRLVRQPDSEAFVIASVPDYMAAAANCVNRQSSGDLVFTVQPQGAQYGEYYATGFRLAKLLESSVVFWTVWSKESGQWKIVSYAVLMP